MQKLGVWEDEEEDADGLETKEKKVHGNLVVFRAFKI